MKKMRMAIAGWSVVVLTACGGGGGGGSGAAPQNTQNAAKAIPVVLTGIDIKPKDVLATTASTSTTVSRAGEQVQYYAGRALGMLVGRAWAAGLPAVRTDDKQDLTFKILEGNLQSLRPTLTPANAADQGQVQCDLGTAQAKVNRVWIGDPVKGTIIANLTVPSTVNADCSLTYAASDFLVTGDGKVVQMDLGTDRLTEVVQAGDEAFNQSGSILLVYSSGQIRAMDVAADGTATFTDLTADGAQLASYTGSFAYNGRFLVGVSSDPGFDGVLIYERGSTSFKMLRPGTPQHYYGVFLDGSGTFVWNWIAGNFKAVDPVAGTYSAYTGFASRSWTFGLYGARGRSGDWFMSDRCVVANMATGDSYFLASNPIQFNPASTDLSVNSPAFSRLSGGQAYCANGSRNIYVRLNPSSGEMKTFDTDLLGYFPKAFTMFADHALVEVVNTASSDRMYVELNFETGETINRGLITTGTRKVVDLMPFGRS